jgi:hypothetical protein
VLLSEAIVLGLKVASTGRLFRGDLCYVARLVNWIAVFIDVLQTGIFNWLIADDTEGWLGEGHSHLDAKGVVTLTV